MPEDFALKSVRVSVSPVDQFERFLRSRGKRLTPQRKAIVEQIFSHHDHFDADELLDHLRELIAQRKVSRPTVYRTLNELVEAGILRRMTLGGRSVYEHQYGYPQHDHLHCEVCNKLIEFHSRELEELTRKVAKQYDFQLRGHRMFIMGICRECRKRQQQPH